MLTGTCQFGHGVGGFVFWRLISFILTPTDPGYPPPHDPTMAGRFSGVGARLPIRHGEGGFTTKFIHSFAFGPNEPPAPAGEVVVASAREAVMEVATADASGANTGFQTAPSAEHAIGRATTARFDRPLTCVFRRKTNLPPLSAPLARQ